MSDAAGLEGLEERVAELEERVDALERFRRQDDDDLSVGDETRVVITDPNYDGDKDPFARINGRATFVRCPEGVQPSLGESVNVVVADIRDEVIVTVAQEDD